MIIAVVSIICHIASLSTIENGELDELELSQVRMHYACLLYVCKHTVHLCKLTYTVFGKYAVGRHVGHRLYCEFLKYARFKTTQFTNFS